MSGSTFDAGMLVALDRNERLAWVILRRSIDRGAVPTIPTVVTAQVWRGGRRQARLAQALAQCRSEPLDHELARRAGELCGRARTSDIVDAVVVESAARRHDDLYTSDADDLKHLANYLTEPVTIVPIGT